MQKLTKQVKANLPKSKQALSLFVVAVLLLIGVVAFLTLRSPDVPEQPEVITYSTDKPSEEKPGDEFQWKGAANDPKKIRIESIGINAFVQKVGVDQNKEVAVPNNIHIAGWFVGSVRPGDEGLSIIDGHIDGVTQDGAVFKTLPNVAKGTEISVEFGDGSIRRFKIIDSQTVPADQAASVLFSQKPKVSNQLNLITCVGNFDTQTNRYDDRLIISAELQ